MASLQAICEGIAANLQQISGLQWSAYMLSSPTPPAGDVYPGDTPGGSEIPLVTYDRAMRRGLDEWMLTARVFVSHTNDIGAQKTLYQFMDSSGPLSVKAALEADRKLGGEVSDLHVVECGGMKAFQTGASRGPLLGCEWRIKVLTEG